MFMSNENSIMLAGLVSRITLFATVLSIKLGRSFLSVIAPSSRDKIVLFSVIPIARLLLMFTIASTDRLTQAEEISSSVRPRRSMEPPVSGTETEGLLEFSFIKKNRLSIKNVSEENINSLKVIQT